MNTDYRPTFSGATVSIADRMTSLSTCTAALYMEMCKLLVGGNAGTV